MSDLLDVLEVDLPDQLLTLALTHRSYAYEHGGLPTNERLEFLGDAVLGLTVTDELFGELEAALGQPGAIELIVVVSQYEAVARIIQALGVVAVTARSADAEQFARFVLDAEGQGTLKEFGFSSAETKDPAPDHVGKRKPN